MFERPLVTVNCPNGQVFPIRNFAAGWTGVPPSSDWRIEAALLLYAATNTSREIYFVV